MKKSILLTALFYTICTQKASAQVTYLADTAFTTDVGFGGAPASCLAPHMEYDGWKMRRSDDVWLADVFTVPTGSTWTFDTVILYGYQVGSSTTSTFLTCNLQIYNGAPDAGGSVIWGDTTTNVLVNTGFTGIYKVDTITAHGGLNSTQRPIMYLKCLLGSPPSLSAGNYWLVWSTEGGMAEVTDAPDKVQPGRINPGGQQGKQLYGGTWYTISDSGNHVGFNKIIKKSASLESVATVNACPLTTLGQNVPNPTTGSTHISFYLQNEGHVDLSIYNSVGQLVKVLVGRDVTAGQHDIIADVNELPEGIYYYTLKTAAGTQSKKMQVLR